MIVCGRQPAGSRRGGLPLGAVQLERAPCLRSASWPAWTRARVELDRANTPQEAWRRQLRLHRARETRFLCDPALNLLAAFRDPGAGIYAEAGSSPRVAVAAQARCGRTGGLGGRRVPHAPP